MLLKDRVALIRGAGRGLGQAVAVAYTRQGARVIIGDARVNVIESLQVRVNQLHDRLEATLKQSLRVASTQQPPASEGATPEPPDPGAQANLMLAYVVGRWHQFAKSGFRRKPTDLLDKQWPLLA